MTYHCVYNKSNMSGATWFLVVFVLLSFLCSVL